MPGAGRVGDITTHGGTVTGPGVNNVMIGGMPAAVMSDMHTCALPPNGHPTLTPFPQGSAKVFIGGRPALRAGDSCGCGAAIAMGAPNVNFG